MRFVMLPAGHFDPSEQERVNALQLAESAVCLTCRKRFSKSTRNLTAGQIALAHECVTGHNVEPMPR